MPDTSSPRNRQLAGTRSLRSDYLSGRRRLNNSDPGAAPVSNDVEINDARCIPATNNAAFRRVGYRCLPW